MKTSRILTTVLPFVSIMSTLPAFSAHVWEEPKTWSKGVFSYDHSTPLYSANEITLDLGGSYTAGQRGVENLFDTKITGRRGRWGGDVGVNYFITRQFGVGADINMPDNGGSLIDAVAVNLIGRFPIGESGFAPYIFAGGGRTTDRSWEWMAQAGLGVEFRFNHIVGVYTDARYQWPEDSADSLLLRAGIRIGF